MRKSFLKILLCLGFVMLGMFSSFACSCRPSAGGDDSNLIPDDAQANISMSSKVKRNKIEISMDSDSELVGSATVKVVALKAYQYLKGDNFSGLSEDVIDLNAIENYTIGEYTLGSQKNLSFDRYNDSGDLAGYDNLYNKYYLVHEDKIVKGPIYATEIEAKYSETPVLNIKSKKGLFAEWNGFSTYKDLGASHTVINFPIETLIHPNELFEDGEKVDLILSEENKAKYIEFVSNGKPYYFNKELVNQWDKEIKDYYSLGSQITAIIVARPNSNEEQFPQKFTYAPYSTQGTKMMGLNTSNSYGFNYYIALIEFLANRYSENNFANGYISNFVIGNEIDYAKDYNRISEKQASLDTYMEEYSRLMRLCNLATRKYSKDITVALPTTQAWAQRGFSLIDGDQVQAYVPKQMIEWLNIKTKMEGDYNWGLAPHVYGYHLPQAGVYYLDTYKNPKLILGEGDMVGGINAGMTNDFNTTSKITFSNLELLDDYLHQSNMRFNDNVRSVYLTESGISSFWNGQPYGGENIQAGTLASVYYKISQLDSIKAFSYYRAFDNKEEAKSYAFFGLERSVYEETPTYEAKPAYEVYKYIDTQYSKVVANKYLKYIEYFNQEQKLQKYGEDFNSYEDLLNIFKTNHTFNFNWDEATPVTADKVYEYEDKIDMQDVKFESQSFMYDSKVHSLAYTGTLPEGVMVEYSQNNSLSEIGSVVVTATFKKDGEIVAQRVATLEVSKIYTNKKIYSVNEKIFVTPYIDSDISGDAWIGIYKENAIIGTDPSVYWYYINTEQDGKLRTVCLQDQIYNKRDSIIAGNYTICYFADGNTNNVRYKTTIKVLPTTKIVDDLTKIEFNGESVVEDGNAHSLLIKNGEKLPNGVTVNYENNNQTQPGIYQIKANFIKNGKVLETRYAVLTIEADDVDRLVVNKTTFEQGEDILITATAFANSANETWWVGLFLSDDDHTDTNIQSIYWYYVKDENHVNGKACNIKEQSLNSNRNDYANLPAGDYKIVLFNTGDRTVEKVVNITIINSTSTETGTISSNKTTYELGEDVLVTATCPEKAGSSTYWVGLYLQDETPSGDVVSIYWYYVKDSTHTSGTAYNIKLQERNNNRSSLFNLPAGNYKLVLFNASGNVEATSLFTINQSASTEEATVVINKTEYNVNEEVLVTATCPNDGNYYWVGLYLKNDDVSTSKSIYWYEVSDATGTNYLCVPSGVSVNIKTGTQNVERQDLFNLPAGEYKIVLFNSSGYTIKTVIEFTIVGE